MSSSSTEAPCEICGEPLHGTWRGDILTWTDVDGRDLVGEIPDGFANPWDWLDAQRERGNIATYSVVLASVLLGYLWPWEHVHRPKQVPYRGTVPAHCTWPMRLLPDGWKCRRCSARMAA